VRGRVDIQGSIISSGGIDNSAVRRCAQANRLASEIACDEAQGTAFALGTGSVKCRLLLFG